MNINNGIRLKHKENIQVVNAKRKQLNVIILIKSKTALLLYFAYIRHSDDVENKGETIKLIVLYTYVVKTKMEIICLHIRVYTSKRKIVC